MKNKAGNVFLLDELLAILSSRKKPLFEKFGAVDVAVFGSYAIEEQEPTSDVDIFVELKKEFKTFDNYMDLKFFLEELLNKKVDLVTKEAIRAEIQPRVFMEAVHV
ncbi:MAG: nucleotidyltransferase family protein [Candidatus Aminicenantes bacterium]|nr:nucleotidyltransferase family protein [Candidatus Aminicenantes bacterium]